MKKINKKMLILLAVIGLMLLGMISIPAAAAENKDTLKAPTNVKAVGVDFKTVRVTWDKVDNVSGYHVYRSTSKNGYYSKVAAIAGNSNTSAAITNVPMKKTFYYKVLTYKGKSKSPFSEIVSTTTKETRPKMVSITSPALRSVKITWTAIPGVNSYHILRKTGNGTYEELKTVNPKTTSYTDTDLQYSTSYRYGYYAVYKIDGKYYKGSISGSLGITTGAPAARYRAVLIGECDYPGTSQDLKGPDNDVNGMNYLLKQMKKPYSTVKRYNQSKAQILSTISNAFRNATANDVSLFYYSGHGVTSAGSSSGGLYTVDGQIITMNELASALNKIPGKVIVLLDSCGSGAAIDTRKGTALEWNAKTYNNAVCQAFALADSGMTEKGTAAKYGELRSSKFIVMTAANTGEYSYTAVLDTADGSELWGGMMTVALIEGAGVEYPTNYYYGEMDADYNNNGRITLAEAYRFVNSEVSSSQNTMVYPSTSSNYELFIRK